MLWIFCKTCTVRSPRNQLPGDRYVTRTPLRRRRRGVGKWLDSRMGSEQICGNYFLVDKKMTVPLWFGARDLFSTSTKTRTSRSSPLLYREIPRVPRGSQGIVRTDPSPFAVSDDGGIKRSQSLSLLIYARGDGPSVYSASATGRLADLTNNPGCSAVRMRESRNGS